MGKIRVVDFEGRYVWGKFCSFLLEFFNLTIKQNPEMGLNSSKNRFFNLFIQKSVSARHIVYVNNAGYGFQKELKRQNLNSL